MPAFAAEIDTALTQFDQACPDRRSMRNAVAHGGDYLIGNGGKQGGSPTFVYESGRSSMFLVIDEGQPPLELDFDGAASAAADLGRAINRVIEAATGH